MPRGGRKRGADTYKIDKQIVPWLKDWCRVAKRTYGLEAIPAIRMLVNSAPWLFGHHKAESTARRLHEKMKSGQFGKPIPPRGIAWHPSQLFLTATETLKTKKKSSKSTRRFS